ncbi:glycoside hydrolase [Mycena capillaripes]|nr:glycoside hydrolase [Mycena capillaripes]
MLSGVLSLLDIRYCPRARQSSARLRDLALAELTCNHAATPATLVTSAAPGDTLLDWNTLTENGNWFHNVGPVLTYLASCGAKNWADFDASPAKWFKDRRAGQDASGLSAQAKLDRPDDGSSASITLLSNLAPGKYPLRHEIAALHTAEFHSSSS